jgi:O-antigen/teichoic acid export membrane protein
MEYDALIQVVQKFGVFAIALVCLALGGRLLGLILVYAIAGCITLAIAARLYHALGFPRLHFSSRTARELILDGAPMLAISLAIAVQPYIDANLLYKLSPTNVVGWFGAAWGIAGTLVAPATILGATMYPRLSRASSDRQEFTSILHAAFRPLLLVAILGAVGAYLFADFAIAVIYSERRFGPAADILRAFAPALMLIYIDMILGYAILALGKASQLAKAKVMAVLVTTAVELVLIPYFQTRFSNGGIGTVLAMACGELVMVAAAIALIRDLVDGGMLVDLLRGLAAGTATILLIGRLPHLTPLLGIPVSVLLFAVFASAVGLVKRADTELLLSSFRTRRAIASQSGT